MPKTVSDLTMYRYETKEIPDLYFSNQTRFDMKSINRHCAVEKRAASYGAYILNM